MSTTIPVTPATIRRRTRKGHRHAGRDLTHLPKLLSVFADPAAHDDSIRRRWTP
jgi:hypothetical protein